MDRGGGFLAIVCFLVLWSLGTRAQLSSEYGCPPQEKILPCRCSMRDMEFQIWCSHSELPKVLEGLKAVTHYVARPVDELILENNNLPSLPGKVFANLRVLRLMLRNNRLERVSSGWLDGLHDSLLELFIVEPDLRSLPVDSLENLQGLEAVTIQSKTMKRLPRFSSLPKLRYLQINSYSLLELASRNFRDLPNLEQLHVFGSPRLTRLEAGLLRGLPRLVLLNVTDCGIHWIHPRAIIDLPELKEVSLTGNSIVDAAMVGRGMADLPALAVIRLDRNRINRLVEGSFADLPMLTRLYLPHNHITEVFAGAFQRVPMLKTLDLNHNLIHRIHPDFFPHRMGSDLEEIWLINNDLNHVAELRAILEALPRLKVLDASHNQLEEIPFGALRGHPTLERLHLDHNRLAFLQRESFTAMPALRELRLRNNSLSNLLEAPFWNLPALKGLDLSGNYFRHVEQRLFANLPSLRRLDLSGNAIGRIEPDSFLSMPALEHVNVSGNALSVLHPLTFRHLTSLYELDVSWNRMLEVVPGLPRNIEHLHMSMNRIISLPSVSSQDLALPMLRSLDISANGVERITPGTFSNLPNLRKLNLGYNSLRIIEDGVFDGLSRLEQLDLKYNRLVTLHGRSFWPLRSLMDLNLRGNRMEVLRPDIFQENPRLQRLDLSRNNLAQIPHSTFINTRDLRELYASHNTLTELPGSLHGLTALQVLDLSFNKLNILSPETLSSLSSLLELRLVRNRIKELREGAFDSLPRLSLIDLENNELRVIERNAVKSLPELQALRLGKNHLQSIPSGAFTELPFLQSVELQENRLREIAGNAFINVPHLLFLNLSHNQLPGLEYVGLESLRSLEVLDLSSNRLAKVSSDSLAAMEWLVELKMDNNRICTIHGSPFDDMPRLRVLSLRSNRMASVSENAFKRLRSNIAILDIDGNPLSCTCGMLWLRGWLQQASSDGPRCADGSLFKEIRLSRDDCQRERQAEPIHPGCESEIINFATPSHSYPAFAVTETAPPWLNLKSTTAQASGLLESDYMYDYIDYHLDNAESPITTTTAPLSTTSSTTTQVPKAMQVAEASKIHAHKNTTAPVKKNGQVPPSPSSSGFTFFGVPLPSLNFNLWGNSARKLDRKEDGTFGRPGRGRYRTFPPTEPEIHRGFVPLPRGDGGFVPIVDPRYTFERQVKNETLMNVSGPNVTRIHVQEERKRVHSSSGSVTKIERTFGRSNKTRPSFREREELSTMKITDHSSSSNNVNTQKVLVNNKTSTSPPHTIRSKAMNETKNKHETKTEETKQNAVSTEIYGGESIEVNFEKDKGGSRVEMTGKMIWTTPRTSVRETTSTSSKDVLETTRSRDRNFWAEEVENSDNASSSTTMSSSSDNTDYTKSSTSAVEESTSEVSSQTERGSEASALSAFLVPGGQVPLSGQYNSGVRIVGKSTLGKITKIPSPHLSLTRERGAETEEKHNEELQTSHEESQPKPLFRKEPTASDIESVKLDDGAFNWYFQNYNDTSVEPYIGTVYSDCAAAKSSQWILLFLQLFVFLRFAKLYTLF